MKIKANRKDIIWNYIGIIISMCSNFLLLPFLIIYVQEDLLGLWYVYLSIGGIVTLFDFGFNPTFSRNVAYCWGGASSLEVSGVGEIGTDKTPNYELLKKVLCTCRHIYFVIAGAAFVILIFLGTPYILYISKEILSKEVIISWGIYAFAVFLNLYYGYFSSFLKGVGAIAQSNKILVISRAVQIIASIILLYLGYGIIAVSIAYLLYGFLLRFLSQKAFFSYEKIGEKVKNKEGNTSRKEEWSLFRIIWHNAWREGLVSLANYLSGQASTLICSLYLPLADTGMYSISVQLITAIATISGGLYTAFQPSMQVAYVTRNTKELKKLMSLSMTTLLFLYVAGVIMLVTIGIPIIKWLKPSTEFNLAILGVISIYNYLYKRHSLYASFISNTNRVPYMQSYLITSVLGVILAVVLIEVFHYGIWGIIIGPMVVQIAYNNWKWPSVVHRELNVSSYQMLRVGCQELLVVAKTKCKRDSV